MGALHDSIQAATTSQERKALRAQAWVDQGLAQGWNFNYRGHKVTLTVAMEMDSGDVVFNATLEQGGVDVTPPLLNPIRIVNPPYMVVDAGGDITLTAIDHDGNLVTIHAREDVPTRIIEELRAIADRIIG